MLPILLPVATCRPCLWGGLSHGQTACEPARRGRLKFPAIGDYIPSKALLKQEGLQLAEASFGEKPMVFWLQISIDFLLILQPVLGPILFARLFSNQTTAGLEMFFRRGLNI